MAASAEAIKCTDSVPLTPNEKVDLLRQYESYCYQVAFYMLNDGDQAKRAVEQALLVLYKQNEWFHTPEIARKAKVKHAALQQALELRKNELRELA
ncbi:hypothetical protein [Paenibacillus radicis (ex Xue et al. 2023)]|uniref:Uncharacterized protein n=1 Tax=Paenibacillus radicis (ex Xue et al. 2023) TaxID=2972489 RepID=A0ABT1YJ81_9BACL|nr:hypothetical protein [Paenibacillus radicis (ex Xue et al. 2023)]MCR8633232.1 hypothetical protein [Paenibacillus radicis (ex Xue et al. 2023)]